MTHTTSNALSAALGAAFGLNAVRQHSIRALGVPVTTGGAGVSKQASSSASTTGYTYRVTCQTAVACTDIRLLFPWGWTLSSTTGDVLQTSAIPFKVSIELTNGTTFPVTFGGARSVNMDPGGYLISDPIAVDLPAGTLFAVRYFFNVTTGALYTQGIGGPPMSTATALNATPTMQILGAGSGRDGFSTSDVTDSGALVGSTYTGAGPPVVLGQVAGPAKPTLIGIGDSITAGTGDSGSGASQYSWFTRGASALPCIRYCVSGITASTILANHLYSGGLLGLASDAVIMLGVNDLFAGATAATLQSSLTSLYQMAVNRGLRVWGCTILPRTTSTDSWATTANQTPVAAVNGARQTVNAWIRAGGGGLLSGYFETADTVESARDSGLWKANGTANAYTVDGTHPSPLGHSLVAAPLYNFTFPAL